MLKNRLKNCLRQENGQTLIMVMLLLVAGSFILPPALYYVGSSHRVGDVYESKMEEVYAADSGIEDAMWQIKYDRLEAMFEDPDYDIYDYDTVWSYLLSDTVNDLTPEVTVQNIWIPKDIPPMDPSEARSLIESNKLMVAGTATDETHYKLKISFYPAEGEEDDLLIDSIGIWLPINFTYAAGSGNMEDDDQADYYSVPTVSPYNGGQAVVWEFESVPYTSFPGVDPLDMPMETEITFEYQSLNPGVTPVAVSWITTGGVADVPLCWDIDTRIYRITSIAGGTEIEAYSAKCELRKMGAAIAGDYRAAGNSLMRDTNHDWYGVRDQLLAENDTVIDDIPSSAGVIAAYLYWAGWFSEGQLHTLFSDVCSNFNNWIYGSCWNISSGHFRSHFSSGQESTRYCTLKNNINLSSYASDTIKIGWEQWEDGTLESTDSLKFQVSADNGASWSDLITAFSNDIGDDPDDYTYTIPSEYLTPDFKFRFYLGDFSGSGEYCYVDDFYISALVYEPDKDVVFKINDQQVYFDAGGQPQTGEEELTATKWSVLENEPGEYSYACCRDVTQLVKDHSDIGDAELHTGNGTYAVGGVDADTGSQWSFAGWSIVIIYSSPETAGHQLYLYDDFAFNHGDENLDFDNDGEPGGVIKGFLVPEPISGESNAAMLTCFVGEGDNCYTGDSLRFNGSSLSDGSGSLSNVWDSHSIGMSEDGVDIDTFYITWASDLLEPGDTTAQLDMPSGTDNWNLVYMILSLRSETVTGGTVHYVIHGRN